MTQVSAGRLARADGCENGNIDSIAPRECGMANSLEIRLLAGVIDLVGPKWIEGETVGVYPVVEVPHEIKRLEVWRILRSELKAVNRSLGKVFARHNFHLDPGWTGIGALGRVAIIVVRIAVVAIVVVLIAQMKEKLGFMHGRRQVFRDDQRLRIIRGGDPPADALIALRTRG